MLMALMVGVEAVMDPWVKMVKTEVGEERIFRDKVVQYTGIRATWVTKYSLDLEAAGEVVIMRMANDG